MQAIYFRSDLSQVTNWPFRAVAVAVAIVRMAIVANADTAGMIANR